MLNQVDKIEPCYQWDERSHQLSIHSSLAESAFLFFNFDKLFIGTDGIDFNIGVTTFNKVHSVSKVMCDAAEKIILLADSSK